MISKVVSILICPSKIQTLVYGLLPIKIKVNIEMLDASGNHQIILT